MSFKSDFFKNLSIMKITKFLIFLSPLLMLLSSCDDLPANAKPWANYEGKRFTSDSRDFYWTLVYFNDLGNTIYAGEESIAQGEFVEFYNITDSEIYIRYGSERPTYYNLADATNNAIQSTVLCPFSPFMFYQYVELPLKFGKKSDDGYYFSGHGEVGKGVQIGFGGSIGENLQIYREDVQYSYDVLKFKEKDRTGTMRWYCFPYSFDTKSLKTIVSPISIDWHTSEWKGDIAQLIENPSDFLQLMLAMPILKKYPYGIYYIELDDYISIERMIRTLFSGFRQSWEKENMADFMYLQFTGDPDSYPRGTFALTETEDGVIKFCIDPTKIFTKDVKFATGRSLFYANCIRSLLSEDRCDVDMRYEIVDAQSPGNADERELYLTLKDPRASRNIMEYLILPLLIENKQRIKDFLLSDSRFAPHGDVLCNALDHLEEIYAGTTELTLGYNMMEHAKYDLSNYEILKLIWDSSEFE